MLRYRNVSRKFHIILCVWPLLLLPLLSQPPTPYNFYHENGYLTFLVGSVHNKTCAVSELLVVHSHAGFRVGFSFFLVRKTFPSSSLLGTVSLILRRGDCKIKIKIRKWKWKWKFCVCVCVIAVLFGLAVGKTCWALVSFAALIPNLLDYALAHHTTQNTPHW